MNILILKRRKEKLIREDKKIKIMTMIMKMKATKKNKMKIKGLLVNRNQILMLIITMISLLLEIGKYYYKKYHFKRL
jgi:hypothetical protein